MKKLALAALLTASVALPTVALAQGAPAAGASASTTTTTTTTASVTKVQLKDGSWAQVAADGSVTVSKDGGKTWMPAPDGVWTSMDGKATITTKGGKVSK